MFQLKLNDIEPVSKPLYYRKNIIAIIGDPRMLKTEGAAPSVASGKISIRSPTGHGPMTRTASARTIASSSRAVFLTFCMEAACRVARLLSRGWRRALQRER
jgi:hypothetical protein